MKILYFGTSTFAIPALRALIEHQHQIVAVVTQPDRPAGRGGKLTPSPVKTVAVELGLPVLQPESSRDEDFLASAHTLAPELNVVAAFGQFLPERLLSLPQHGSVNLHGSLLPKYRGAAPIQRAIWHGDETTGVSLMWMVKAMDAGDVIACAEEPIQPTDNAGTLSERLARRAAELLIAWLPSIANGDAPHRVQDPAHVTFAPAIGKEEREIDWQQSALAIWRQIRALAPTPAATTTFRGMPVKILAASLIPDEHIGIAGTPGEIVETNPRLGLYVATGMGPLQIASLQPAGKRPISGTDFLCGYRVMNGERFLSLNEHDV